MSSSWAGAGMGAIALPRVEDEVLVEFLEGDPDKPIITGCSYHALNRQPFRLPDHKTMTGVKTQTHKGEGYNQLSFEDQNEKEQIHFHAEKDMNVAVQNVKNERIEWDHLKSIGHDEKTDIAQDLYVTVDGEEHHTTKKDLKRLIEGKKSLTIEGDLVEGILGAFGMKSEGEAVLESGGSITLKVGSSFVVINAGGVHIQGNEVTVNSGGTPGDVVVPMDPRILEVAAGEGEAFVHNAPKENDPNELFLFSE